MESFRKEIEKMKNGDKIEVAMKGFFVLNSIPQSQRDDIIKGLLAAASLYDLDVDKVFSKRVPIKDVQLGNAKPVW